MNRQKLIELIEIVASNSDVTSAATLADAIINNRDLWLDDPLLKLVNESEIYSFCCGKGDFGNIQKR